MSAAPAFVAAACGAAGLLMLVPPGRGGGAARAPAAAEPAGAARGAVLLRLLARAGRRLRPLAEPHDLRARLDAAGRPAGLGVRELMAAKLAAAIGAGGLGLPLGSLAPGRLGVLLTVLAPVCGFLAPDAWLARLAAERARRVRRELPQLLDLLRVTVEAGEAPARALAQVGERGDGPLAREWRVVGREVALGVPLAEALEALTRRLPQPEVRAFVAALERARRHGAPLSATLAAQASAARFALARRVRDDAARAGPKLQLVVALLLVPSVLLLVAAALASALLGGGADALPL